MEKKYLMDFFYINGRISRATLIYRVTSIGITCAAFGMLANTVFGNSGSATIAAIFIWSFIALAIQRLHDVGCTGWCLLYFIIPVFGPLYLFVQLMKKGADGENRFGNDPLTQSDYLTVDISR